MIHQNRTQIIDQIVSQPQYDLAIIGGGIHGAVLARLASQYGLKVVLLEKGDYASGASSKSSKMAHGGLRYLELLDFQQVFEGVKAREKLYNDYPEQVIPYPFFIPVPKKAYYFRVKLALGLWLYDFFQIKKRINKRWFSAKKAQEYSLIPEEKTKQLMGCYCYSDGLMCDYRLVIDNISLARKTAQCLNYAEVKEVKFSADRKLSSISFQDLVSGSSFQCQAKTVINTTGVNVSDFCKNSVVSLKYSRGSHLIFSRPWHGPALFLPMPGKSRYYFVWPHFAGTMVGTTEREIEDVASEPIPSEDEVVEILERLEKDLPGSGLDKNSLHFAFAGIRALPVRQNSPKNTAQISRKHFWYSQDNIFSLYGGKFTTSEWTAREGLKLILKKLELYSKIKFKDLESLSITSDETLKNSEIKKNLQVFPSNEARLKFNLPLQCNFLLDAEHGKWINDVCLSGEIYNAFVNEQATNLDDFLFRRTGLGYMPYPDVLLRRIKEQLLPYISEDLIEQQIVILKNRKTRLVF